MTSMRYRYCFAAGVPAEEIESSLLLAVLAAEALYGETRVRLDAEHAFDPAHKACVIGAGTEVGADLNQLFVSFASRQFGADSFRVERVDGPAPRRPSRRRTAAAA